MQILLFELRTRPEEHALQGLHFYLQRFMILLDYCTFLLIIIIIHNIFLLSL